ncbi:MAG: tetratricopeptide repeat protein, partial [Spirochaetota bacterium]
MYHTKNFFRVFLLTAFCVLTTVPLVASSYSRGMSQFMRKNYDEARTLLNQAVEEDPSNGNAYYYLGEIEKNTKNYPTAIDYYLKALDNRLNQKYVKLTYWNLIILTEQRNDLNAMVKTCKSFYRKTGDRGAMEKVNSLINKMLWTNNQDAISEYNLGKTALASNRTEDAAGHFRNALREDSSFLAPRFELGMIAHKNGDVNEAVQQLHVIADRIPFYTSVQQLTADMYMKLRAWSNAKRYYTNIIEYGFINQETLRSVLIRRSQSSFQLRRYSDAEDDILRAQAIR